MGEKLDKAGFLEMYARHEAHIEALSQKAAQVHAKVNQTYGDGLPYAFHLRLTASYVTRFSFLLPIKEEEIETVYAAAYFHDSLEDARLTYNDLTKLLSELKQAHGLELDVQAATEAVYALTNDKGRTRAERAGEKYYAGIRATKYAPFLKMCDRLANIRYSTLHGLPTRMQKVYAQEMPHFLASIGNVPQEMVAEAWRMLREG